MVSRFVSIITLASVFFLFSLGVGAQAETWKITSLDWQPYSGSDMANKGSSVEKLKEILKSEGIELVVEFYPWLRAQKLAKTKDFIGYYPAWPEEVTTGFIASPPVDYSSLGALTYKGSTATWIDVENAFAKYKIGVVKTYVYPKSIEDAMKKYPKHVDLTPDEESLAKKLVLKRFEIALTDPKVMGYYTDKLKITGVVPIKTIEKKELVIALRNDAENVKRIELIKAILGKHLHH